MYTVIKLKRLLQQHLRNAFSLNISGESIKS